MKQLNLNCQATTPLLPKPVMPITFSKSSSSKFYCSDCDLAFILERDLQNHYSVTNSGSHQTSSIIFNCTECTLQFSTFRGMKQHMGKIHHKKKNLPCGVCGKLFKDKYAIKFHQLHVHDSTQKVKCEKCSLVCYTKYVYKEHVKKCGIDTENL